MITHDILLVRGDDLKPLRFTHTSETIDFSGATARSHVKSDSSDSRILCELSASVTTGGTVGAYTIQVALSASNAVTANLPIGIQHYDIKLEYGGIVETIVTGKFEVLMSYTR